MVHIVMSGGWILGVFADMRDADKYRKWAHRKWTGVYVTSHSVTPKADAMAVHPLDEIRHSMSIADKSRRIHEAQKSGVEE